MSVFDGEAATLCAVLLSSAASDNAQNMVNRPCALKGIQGYNARTSAVFLKLYDKVAAPTSADIPVKPLCIPASSAFVLDYPDGFAFANGIGIRLTTGVADNDTGVVAAGDILALNLDYV